MRRVRKTLAGPYYQLLLGHAETRTHLFASAGWTRQIAGGAPAESLSLDTASLRSARHGDGRTSGRPWSRRGQGPRWYGICGRGTPRTPFWSSCTHEGGCVGVGECPRMIEGRRKKESRARTTLDCILSSVSPWSFPLFYLLLEVWGLYSDRLGRPGARNTGDRKTPPPLPWPSRPHVAG